MIKVKDERTRYEVVWDKRVFKTYRYGAFVGNWMERGNLPEKQAQKKAEEILKKLADSVPPDVEEEDAGDYI